MFKIRQANPNKDYFRQHQSCPLELTEEEYAKVFAAAGDVKSMGDLFRQMLEHGLDNPPAATRTTSFWIPALFYAKVKRAAADSNMSLKTYVHAVIRQCIKDMGKKRAQGSRKALDRGAS